MEKKAPAFAFTILWDDTYTLVVSLLWKFHFPVEFPVLVTAFKTNVASAISPQLHVSFIEFLIKRENICQVYLLHLLPDVFILDVN